MEDITEEERTKIAGRLYGDCYWAFLNHCNAKYILMMAACWMIAKLILLQTAFYVKTDQA